MDMSARLRAVIELESDVTLQRVAKDLKKDLFLATRKEKGRKMNHFKTGDRVRVTLDGQTADGVVELSSPNGRSLVIFCEDDMLGGYVQRIPVLWTGVSFTDLIRDRIVQIEPR